MHFVRKILVVLATTLLSLWLLLTVMTASIVLTLHSPAKIKGWVNDSGIYTKVVDAVLTQSQQSAQKSGDSLPIQDPQIQAAARTAFSPQVLQKDTENVIDGTYHWLHGKTPQPDFRVDLSGPKQQFASGVGDYLRNRVQSVPACARGQVPDTDDLFSINCLPRGFDVNAEVQQQVDKLANGKDFLSDPVITAQTLKKDGNQSPFDKFKALPKIYQKATWSPWLFGSLALLSAGIIIFLHDERRRGMKRVARILLPTGVLLVFIGVATLEIAKRGAEQIKLNGEGVSQLRPSVISLIHSIAGSLSHVYIWFGVGYAVIGIGLLVAVKLWLKPAKSSASAASSDKKPVKSSSSPKT